MCFLWGAGGDRGGIWEMGKGQGRAQLQRHPGKEIPCGSRQDPAWKRHRSSPRGPGPVPNWEHRASARTDPSLREYLGIP